MRFALLFALFAVAQARGSLQESSPPKGFCDNVQQYSGYYKLSGLLPKNYFYWFFESRNDPANDPVVLWMTGGPGCSSEVALFGENGPCQVNAEGSNTTSNPFSWNTKANILYIDQPAGTGFSYPITSSDHDEAGVAKDMYDFLQQFFKEHTKYNKLPFYAFGESYAGHYVPAVTHKIWDNNRHLPGNAIRINLKGTSVGNGLTDPEVQYKYYADMAISTNDHKAAVNEVEYLAMKAATGPCVEGIKQCQTNVTACLTATDVCNLGLVEPYALSGRNVYDMRIPCEVPPLCYNFSNHAVFLARPDVQAALGVTGHKWQDCNKAVTIQFELSGDEMHNFQTMIPDQLAAGIKVLMYAGDQDYICNWLGNQAWTLALDWPHHDDFNTAPMANWTTPEANTTIGQMRTANGFSFLRVYDAGHMVPRDQPQNALAMLNAFISDSFP